MNVSVPIQWLGRRVTAAAGYQSVVPIIKYQGVWISPAGHPLYETKNQAECGHHLVAMPKNEVHGQVGKLQTGALGVGQHVYEREEKAEIFRAQFPECYTMEANKEVHPTIAGMMQNYNKKFSELRISNVCDLAGVKI